MHTDIEFLIIGGNPTSLLLTQALSDRSFLCVLDAPALEGVHYEYLFIDDNKEFAAVDLPPTIANIQLRHKGEWEDVSEDHIKVLPPLYKSYIQSEKFQSEAFNQKFSSEVIDDKNVIPLENFSYRGLDLKNKRLTLVDGTTIHFQKLIWCKPSEDLKGLYELDIPKFKYEAETRVECCLKLENGEDIAHRQFIFPFKFKDHKLNAICFLEGQELWIYLSLPEELSENHEETSKVLRTMHRELKKEFPHAIKQETFTKIFSKQIVPADMCARTESYQVADDVFCFLPELALKDDEIPQSYLERSLKQKEWLQKLI